MKCTRCHVGKNLEDFINERGTLCKSCDLCRLKSKFHKEINYDDYHEKIDCECGGSYTWPNQLHYFKSQNIWLLLACQRNQNIK